MSPSNFSHVLVQALAAHPVVGADVAPIEHAPEALNSVGVGLSPDVLPD